MADNDNYVKTSSINRVFYNAKNVKEIEDHAVSVNSADVDMTAAFGVERPDEPRSIEDIYFTKMDDLVAVKSENSVDIDESLLGRSTTTRGDSQLFRSLDRMGKRLKFSAVDIINRASKTKVGIVRIGGNIDVDDDGLISVPNASDTQYGLVKIGKGFKVNEDGSVSPEAEKYVHPETHPASMIDTDDQHMFVTKDILRQMKNAYPKTGGVLDGSMIVKPGEDDILPGITVYSPQHSAPTGRIYTENDDSFVITNRVSTNAITMKPTGETLIDALNLKTQSKEVIGAINELKAALDSGLSPEALDGLVKSEDLDDIRKKLMALTNELNATNAVVSEHGANLSTINEFISKPDQRILDIINGLKNDMLVMINDVLQRIPVVPLPHSRYIYDSRRSVVIYTLFEDADQFRRERESFFAGLLEDDDVEYVKEVPKYIVFEKPTPDISGLFKGCKSPLLNEKVIVMAKGVEKADGLFEDSSFTHDGDPYSYPLTSVVGAKSANNLFKGTPYDRDVLHGEDPLAKITESEKIMYNLLTSVILDSVIEYLTGEVTPDRRPHIPVLRPGNPETDAGSNVPVVMNMNIYENGFNNDGLVGALHGDLSLVSFDISKLYGHRVDRAFKRASIKSTPHMLIGCNPTREDSNDITLAYMFADCVGTPFTVSKDLFKGLTISGDRTVNIDLTGFFAGSNVTHVPDELLPTNEVLTKVNNINVSLMFAHCEKLTGRAPRIFDAYKNPWSELRYRSRITYDKCYIGNPQLSNYKEIPEDWGGPEPSVDVPIPENMLVNDFKHGNTILFVKNPEEFKQYRNSFIQMMRRDKDHNERAIPDASNNRGSGYDSRLVLLEPILRMGIAFTDPEVPDISNIFNAGDGSKLMMPYPPLILARGVKKYKGIYDNVRWPDHGAFGGGKNEKRSSDLWKYAYAAELDLMYNNPDEHTQRAVNKALDIFFNAGVRGFFPLQGFINMRDYPEESRENILEKCKLVIAYRGYIEVDERDTWSYVESRVKGDQALAGNVINGVYARYLEDVDMSCFGLVWASNDTRFKGRRELFPSTGKSGLPGFIFAHRYNNVLDLSRMFCGVKDVEVVNDDLLKYIPDNADPHKGAPSLASIEEMFKGSSIKRFRGDKFIDNLKNINFKERRLNADGLFENCTKLTEVPILYMGKKEIWDNPPEITHARFFSGCTGMVDYDTIPEGWK